MEHPCFCWIKEINWVVNSASLAEVDAISFQNLDNQGIMRFFENLGIALKEEDNGRMFPVTDKAKTVVDALVGKIVSLGVEIRTKEPVKELIQNGQQVQGVKLMSGKTILGRSVIIATGGKSVPQTGSTGDGYPWAEAAGHTITELYPTEVPIVSGESWIQSKELQGLSLRDIGLSVLDAKGKTVISHRGDMIFTHFGVSGPMKSGNPQVIMSIDLFPELSAGALEAQVQQSA
ncbi:hypothetical protein HK101_002476 [Irineochytrium annulatum]|nr:hypothetical protein HK101_002476 [Irineochytrium annulatum]